MMTLHDYNIYNLKLYEFGKPKALGMLIRSMFNHPISVEIICRVKFKYLQQIKFFIGCKLK